MDDQQQTYESSSDTKVCTCTGVAQAACYTSSVLAPVVCLAPAVLLYYLSLQEESGGDGHDEIARCSVSGCILAANHPGGCAVIQLARTRSGKVGRFVG